MIPKKYRPLPTQFLLTCLMCGLIAAFPAHASGGQDALKTTGPAYEESLRSLIDAVYDGQPPAEIEKSGGALLERVLASPETADIAASEIEYCIGRAWNESGDKKKAIIHFEAALKSAEKSLSKREDARGLLALTRATSELCLLKDMVFLMTNGPKINRYAARILELEPGNPGASLILASSKAYPPAIFGGNPREAIESVTMLLSAQGNSFKKDHYFDAYACLGTAYEKLGKKTEAASWFAKALQLYPGNRYAREMMEKLSK